MLQVITKYSNIHDENCCLVWIPEMDNFDEDLHKIVTDDKRHLMLSDIAARFTSRSCIKRIGSSLGAGRGLVLLNHLENQHQLHTHDLSKMKLVGEYFCLAMITSSH
ncbi:hypothetical protein DPMN_078227 [Dreissena polymorpha]|uniref:Uncharacterized protein n=1 Tax=Dreissena polymorpha TaxID=45954 RepID=A0A9D3YRE7_DREPO|nr:hypothetical protein DPMN_078227 [Dreissena polymorpha]